VNRYSVEARSLGVLWNIWY